MVKLILLKNKGVKALNVIQMTTEDRLNETKKLFEQVKPLLEKGFSYSGAVRKLKGLPKNHNFANMAWYKELLEYGESQGYPRKNHIRSKKNGM